MPTTEKEARSPDGGLAGEVLDPVAGFAAEYWKPKPYQVRGVNWLLQLTDMQVSAPAGAALFLPPGLGKTSIGLEAITMLKQHHMPHRALVLAPLMVCRTTWMTEPKKWRQFQGLKVGLAHGPNRHTILEDPSYDIVVMNYDGIEWAVPVLEYGHSFAILLCDELPRLKNTASKRYKRIKHSLRTFSFRWGFTGTPVANGLVDLFGQVYVLDGGARLSPFITKFRSYYFYQKPFDLYRWHITPQKSAELTDKLKDLAMYVKPEEWLDLPPFLTLIRECVLPDKARAKYKFLEDEYLLQLETTTVTVANAGILTTKLRQFSGGGIYTSPGIWEEVDDTKLMNLESLVEELAGEPLLVAYQFEHELERILKSFPNALYLKGGMPEKKVTETVQQWNLGEVPLMLVQPQAAAHGINLQFGGAAIAWFTMTYNLEDFIQLNSRIYRQGQTKTVRCYLLVAKDTIDQRVAKILANKDAVQNDLLATLKFERNEL